MTVLAGAAGWLLVQSRWLTLNTFLGSLFLPTWSWCSSSRSMPAADQPRISRAACSRYLLTTPAGEDVYLRGRMLLLKRRWLWPTLLVLAIDFGLMLAGCWDTGLNWEWLGWIGAFLVLGVKLALDLYALSWVGFWQALKLAHTARALRRTVFDVFLFKWLILFACLALIGLATEGRVFRSPVAAVITAIGYVVLWLMTLLHFSGMAMSELHDTLRLLVLQRGVLPPPPASPGKSLRPNLRWGL